jgi:hypothetical protein
VPNALPGTEVFGTWEFRLGHLSDGPKIQGATLSFNNFRFLLAMDDPPAGRSSLFEAATYRPREICVKGKGVILFAWDETGDDRCITC